MLIQTQPRQTLQRNKNDSTNPKKPYSEATAELIDQEAKSLIAEQYARAKELLKEHAEGHNQLAQLLIDREVIFAEDVENIFGKRPFASRTEELLEAPQKSETKTRKRNSKPKEEAQE